MFSLSTGFPLLGRCPSSLYRSPINSKSLFLKPSALAACRKGMPCVGAATQASGSTFSAVAGLEALVVVVVEAMVVAVVVEAMVVLV